MQRHFYSHYVDALFSPDLSGLFERRLSTALPASCNPLPGIIWEPIFAVLRRLPMHVVMIHVKTWANSWVTAARYHMPRNLGCLFCCPASDDLINHYIVCTRLWRVVRDALRLRSTGGCLDRLNIIDPSRSKAIALALVYTVYHAVRNGHHAKAEKAIATRDFTVLAGVAKETAAAAALRLR